MLFQDYGILLVQKKKKVREKTLDIGYGIGCEIVTQQQRDIHTIGNIKIISQFSYENRNFRDIEIYLRIIGYVLREVPKYIPQYEIYNILIYIQRYNSQINYTKMVLIFLKIQCVVWNIGEEYDDNVVKKIVAFVRHHSVWDIMRLSGIQEDILGKLEKLL